MPDRPPWEPAPLHYAMLPMEEYQTYLEFRDTVEGVERAIERGRIEGKLDGYRQVLAHVQTSPVLGAQIPGRMALVGTLERLIETCTADLRRLTEEAARRPVAP
jgi:hypothetical protein